MKWTLFELEPQKNGERRWSVGENGPRAYLTTDENTARLISAAPELLEALRELLRETNQHADSDCPKLYAACDAARAAIRKAKEG